jgi:hypothetical protein
MFSKAQQAVRNSMKKVSSQGRRVFKAPFDQFRQEEKGGDPFPHLWRSPAEGRPRSVKDRAI